MTTAKSSVVPG